MTAHSGRVGLALELTSRGASSPPRRRRPRPGTPAAPNADAAEAVGRGPSRAPRPTGRIRGLARPAARVPDRRAPRGRLRLFSLETHEAVFTWVLQQLADAGLVQGKTLGIDATTLEANAAMRAIVRRDTGEDYRTFLTRLAQASGIETPTAEELARFDRKRKKKMSNEEWTHPGVDGIAARLELPEPDEPRHAGVGRLFEADARGRAEAGAGPGSAKKRSRRGRTMTWSAGSSRLPTQRLGKPQRRLDMKGDSMR